LILLKQSELIDPHCIDDKLTGRKATGETDAVKVMAKLREMKNNA
jgi:hypothetical protein